MTEEAYTIKANISQFEFKVIQHIRELKTHGWGALHVDFEATVAVNCKRTLSDDPRILRQMQKNGE